MGTSQRIDDLILEGRIIQALQSIRATEECSLPQAVSSFDKRYELLRQTRPNDFKASREDYGRGVYT